MVARWLFCVLSLWGCTHEAPGEHLTIVSGGLKASASEVDALLEFGEELHTAIAALHPTEVTLEPNVRVELNGRYKGEAPYVDEDGTVQLWRFSDAEGGYEAMFAHELVHAIAYWDLVDPAYAKWEDAAFYLEGWAEYAALLAHPGKTGFPLFGYDEDVVVGYWLDHGGITVTDLRARHDELNMRCQAQGYILRASWFRYVDEELGRDVVWQLVTARDAVSQDDIEAALGASVEQVDADWAAWASARYQAHPSVDTETEGYLGRMTWYEPCVE